MVFGIPYRFVSLSFVEDVDSEEAKYLKVFVHSFIHDEDEDEDEEMKHSRRQVQLDIGGRKVG
jgi:hypothetical protein